MLILKLLFVTIMAISIAKHVKYISMPYVRVEGKPSIYERVLLWALEIDERLKNSRRYSQEEVNKAIGDLQQWHYFLKQVPSPKNKLSLVKK